MTTVKTTNQVLYLLLMTESLNWNSTKREFWRKIPMNPRRRGTKVGCRTSRRRFSRAYIPVIVRSSERSPLPDLRPRRAQRLETKKATIATTSQCLRTWSCLLRTTRTLKNWVKCIGVTGRSQRTNETREWLNGRSHQSTLPLQPSRSKARPFQEALTLALSGQRCKSGSCKRESKLRKSLQRAHLISIPSSAELHNLPKNSKHTNRVSWSKKRNNHTRLASATSTSRALWQ